MIIVGRAHAAVKTRITKYGRQWEQRSECEVSDLIMDRTEHCTTVFVDTASLRYLTVDPLLSGHYRAG